YSLQNVESTLEPILDLDTLEESDIKYKSTELDTSVFEILMPATVLVNGKNELVRSYGECGKFLSVPVGEATHDIFALIRDDLKIALSTVLRDCRKKKQRVGYEHVPVQLDEEPEYISIVAQPIRDNRGQPTNFDAIAFIRGSQKVPGDMESYQIDNAASQRISDLEHELKMTKHTLRQTVTELESVNAELQAANEELLTANEELQSSNEELQSVNEELYTVNSEYQSKVTELAAANDDMANFLSTTLVGVLMVDRDLNIRKFSEYVSDEFNVVEQDVGRPLRFISYNFVALDMIDLCRRVLNTMEPVEAHAASVAGKTYMIRIVPYLAQDDHSAPGDGRLSGEPPKKLQGLVITFVDTSEQVDDREQIEDMAAALREAVRTGQEKERFLSQMSHDMRTPMTAISGLTHLTLQKQDLPQDVRDNLNKVQTSSNYMLSLIEEILETSRINAGKVVTVAAAVKEDNVLNSVATIIREQANQAGLSFEMDIRGVEGRYVMMDAKHVERALMNLLSNSVRFTPEGGKVSLLVSVRYVEGRAEYLYMVRDNGIGISEDFQEKMFLPFEQYNDSPEYSDGSGLGLYICKNLIELMGGTISCWSKVGEGTEFTVKMSYPLASDEQISVHAHQSENFEDQVLYGKNVLVVEDNNINAEVIIELLNTKGIHSEWARDGREAVDIFESRGEYHFQAILMDLMMPVMNGMDATREIRSLPMKDAQTVPIIALTADATSDAQERINKAGMNYFLTKPIDHEKLFSFLSQEFIKR
ncbi:MAG: response regulator, partial [Lachnospiraceae bacterium]|nr:response regulator [Lachnospiraceae bacterium]